MNIDSGMSVAGKVRSVLEDIEARDKTVNSVIAINPDAVK